MCLRYVFQAPQSNESVVMKTRSKKQRKDLEKPVTAKQWVESLTEDLLKRPARVISTCTEGTSIDTGSAVQESSTEPSRKVAETVAKCVHNMLIHHPARCSQYELPQNRRSSLSLHLSQEPRQGVHLGILDRVRLRILKRRIISTRKNSAVSEIRHNPYGLPDFEELFHATDQHVAFQRRKLFDTQLDPKKRHYAFDSILNDYDILCPIKPSPHLKQISRVRDRHRLCLIGRSAPGCPFEASDFMARWLYHRSLQSMELNGMQLTKIKEEPEPEMTDLSRTGCYKYGKCLASKLVAARKSARMRETATIYNSDDSAETYQKTYDGPSVKGPAIEKFVQKEIFNMGAGEQISFTVDVPSFDREHM